MTSDPSTSTFVWVFLPGQTLPTLCGRFNHAMTPGGGAVGKFVYGKTYLADSDAVAIDPITLPLADKEFSTTSQRGIFGVFVDAMPDDWGQFVIDQRKGRQPSPVGYLTHSLEDRVGNLSFSRSVDTPPQIPILPGRDILDPARKVIAGLELGRPLPAELEHVIQPNTALGGARPKITIEDAGSQWLAKFPSRRDSADFPVARIEAAPLDLATRCGITSAHAEVVHIQGDDILLVKRFDRMRIEASGWCRDPFISAQTVFHSSPEVQAYAYAGSYPRLSRELTRWSADAKRDRRELFRRMVFNCVMSNTDDHERNHGFIGDDVIGSYRLSPAYDMVPSIHGTTRRFQALGIGENGAEPTAHNILSDCTAFDLTYQEAARILKEIQEQAQDEWKMCLVKQGLSASAIDKLAQCVESLPPDTPFESPLIFARPVQR